MNRRRAVLAALGVAALAPLVVRPQTQRPRVGVLTSIALDKSAFFPPFVKRFAELGYIDKRTVNLDVRSSLGNPALLPKLAQGLLDTRPELIVALGTLLDVRVLQEAKVDVPVVFIAVNYDPVDTRIVSSYSRPDGNFTGVYVPQALLAAKRLELTRELLASLARVLVMSDRYSNYQLDSVRKAAAGARIQAEIFQFGAQPYDYAAALERGRAARSEALVGLASPEFQSQSTEIAKLLLKYRLPSVGFLHLQTEAGYLASYGAEADTISGRAAVIADRVLRGARPAEIPVEQANEYSIAVNLKTARALGFKIPNSIMLRADRVFE